ncbi:hypothetical protein [Natrarchaeobaculum sulfurireducens]|uniref:Uncharacterized protein n=1 Tax=Natrarchaeobaculum sulfurireducens TaxID=2044521 RepID=A0A346PK51_9EURY|nr:hypothetical protein [Natrarchaeobaculum sulfurireducens]AXR79896.1 hypothetical protein AArcMg_4071 [Natrarchaeobaculum sulfurireducens]
MSNTTPYQEANWSEAEDTLEELVADDRVRLTWRSAHQSHLSSIEGTVIEAERKMDSYRIATPARNGELQLYRPPKSTDFDVYAITDDGTIELGTLHGVDVLELERPDQAGETDGFYPAILEWRGTDD